jgi:hypothetical protein
MNLWYRRLTRRLRDQRSQPNSIQDLWHLTGMAYGASDVRGYQRRARVACITRPTSRTPTPVCRADDRMQARATAPPGDRTIHQSAWSVYDTPNRIWNLISDDLAVMRSERQQFDLGCRRRK